MSEPSGGDKRAVLDQILNSPEFQDSKRHRELLQYLVEKSSTTDSLKETEIAQELFGKDSKFDPGTDPLIRSYISNLRKKLDHYYLTTADKYDYKLEIPKGHYLVRYTSVVHPRRQVSRNFFTPYLYPAIIFFLSGVIVFFIIREFERSRVPDAAAQPPTASPLWKQFLQPNARQTLIVLGDFFFLRGRNKTDGYYRTSTINTIEDYLEYINRDPEFGRRYTKNNFTFLRPSAPWCLMEILPLLSRAPNGVSLKLASQFTSDDFKTNNIIYIGSFKTLYLLKNFLNILNLDYTVSPSSFRVQDGAADSLYVFNPEKLSAGNLEKDYGVVAKGQGPDGSTILMLLGFSESGVIQASHAAKDPELFKAISEKFRSGVTVNPDSITIVIGAEGITQSLYQADIKYVTGFGASKSGHGQGQADTVSPR